MLARNLTFSAVIFTGFLLTSVQSHAGPPKTLVYCSEGSPSVLNPQIASDGTTYNVTRHIYDKLLRFRYGSTEIEPALAESWTVSPDGKTYTFKLRKGVKFHKTAWFTPTREMNADDVLFSFNRQRLKDHPYHDVGGGAYEYFSSMEMEALIQDIKKIDDYTVEFTLSRPETPFLANVAMDFASIFSAEYAETLAKKEQPNKDQKDKIDTEPVGTGPFVFVRYDKDQAVRLDGNLAYYLGKPALDKLLFTITQDPSVRFQKLKTGECDFVTEPAPSDLAAMKKGGLTVMQKPGVNVMYLAFNVEKEPFNNPLVRQAIHLALNRKSYIDAIYLGNAVVAKNPIPPSMWSYNEKVKDYEYSPEKARELLTQAGFPNGFETELWTMPVARPYNPNGKKMGELMQADLAKVGINVKLITYDWPTYLDKSKDGDHGLLQMGWTGDNGDPDNFLNVLLGCAAVEGGGNRARWCDKSFDDLIQKARTSPDQKKRTELYLKAQEIFKKEAPWVTIAHSTVFRSMSSKVTGYKIDPFGADYFYPVDKK